eukprot:UN26601
MIHHSVPGLVSPVRPQSTITLAVKVSYIISFIMCTVLCLMAMIAFGNVKNESCQDKDSDPCKINELYNLNFSSYHIRWISTFVDTYPLLMVALFPLVGISLTK